MWFTRFLLNQSMISSESELSIIMMYVDLKAESGITGWGRESSVHVNTSSHYLRSEAFPSTAQRWLARFGVLLTGCSDEARACCNYTVLIAFGRQPPIAAKTFPSLNGSVWSLVVCRVRSSLVCCMSTWHAGKIICDSWTLLRGCVDACIGLLFKSIV